MKFRCPVCKSQIPLDLESSPRIKCAKCESTYSVEKVKQLLASKRKSATAADSKPDTISSWDSSPEFDFIGPIHPDDVPAQISQHSASLIRTKSKKSGKRLYLLLALFVLVLGLIGLLLFVMQPTTTIGRLPDHDDLAAAATAGQAQIVPGPVSSDDDSSGIDLSRNQLSGSQIDPFAKATNEQQQESSRVPFGQLDIPDSKYGKPDNQYKARKTLEDCWFHVKPYLVELHAETPTGPRFATGIVVDSRGWVATSFTAMQSATAIHVRQASRSAENKTDILADQVQGVVADSPDHDLLLLAINRRLVNTFEDLPISMADDLVASQYVIQCTPPTQLFPFSTVESRIVERAKSSEFSGELADELSRLNLSKDIRWIRHQQNAPLRFGAPLVNDAGDLVAMNTAVVTANGEELLAIPASYIAAIKKLATTQVQPLPVRTRNIGGNTSGRNDQRSEQPDPMEVVDVDSSARDLSEALNRLGGECESFGWWPGTDSETGCVREFVHVLAAVNKRIEEQDLVADSADGQTLSDQVSDWLEKLEIGLGVSANRERAAQITFNRKFADVLGGPEEPFVGYAFVKYSAVESPHISFETGAGPTESVVFEFKGTKGRVICQLDNQWPPLPPDSPWLIIGHATGGVVRLKDRSNRMEELQLGIVSTVIQSN